MRTLNKKEFDSAGYHTVGVEFKRGGTIYTYLSARPCKINDMVVVVARGEFKCVYVVALNTPTPKLDTIKYKWIVGYVDTSDYPAVQDITLVE